MTQTPTQLATNNVENEKLAGRHLPEEGTRNARSATSDTVPDI